MTQIPVYIMFEQIAWRQYRVGVVQKLLTDLILFLHLFNPFVGLTLRIDEKSPTLRKLRNDRIFRRKGITG